MKPIERAAQSLPAALATTEQLEHLAHAVYEAIDTDQLANAIPHSELGCCVDCPQKHSNGELVEQALEIALAVKNWLTGKDQQ